MSTFNPIKVLEGTSLKLRGLKQEDFQAMFKASSDLLIWEQTPYQDRYKQKVFKAWFDDAIREQALVIIDKKSGEFIGSSRYYETDFEKSETAIGYTFLVREHWGGTTNLELKTLMFKHAWNHFKTVWLHIAESNTRSRKAAEKIGAKLLKIGEKNGLPYCWYILEKGSL